MESLLSGFQRFRATAFRAQEENFRKLAVAGQSPKALVVACCDSRVDPQLIFQATPGDLFVVRNVANLVPPYAPNSDYHGTSAAVEFAVCGLGVPEIIVMGHTGCGGIRALLEHDEEHPWDFIGPWMSIADSVRADLHVEEREVTDEDRAQAERQAVRLSLANLMTFPWLRDRVRAGALRLHGMLFDIASAELLVLDAATGDFAPVTPDTGTGSDQAAVA